MPRGKPILVTGGTVPTAECNPLECVKRTLCFELAEHCARRASPVFVGTPSERSYYENFAVPSAINLCGRTSLQEAWSVLRGAQAVYCTDTCLMHMAAAANPHVTSIFGPTHPARKCPLSAKWVWGDGEQYDPSYELFGTVPAGCYFGSLTVADILEPHGSQPQPSCKPPVPASL